MDDPTTSQVILAPAACTLPVADRPLRQAEFVSLLSRALRGARRTSPTTLVWLLDPAAEADARDLAAWESACCSFFDFRFTRQDDGLQLTVQVPPQHVEVLDALGGLAELAGPAGAPR